MNDHIEIQITGVRTVGVPVTDQDRALDFYTGTLGFTKRLDVPYGDDDEAIDGARPADEEDPFTSIAPTTVLQFATRWNLKSTDVLLKVLGWGKKDVHINSPLDAETLEMLGREFNVKERPPFPSPHRQPPFMPRPAPYTRDIVVDGGRAALGRGLRID